MDSLGEVIRRARTELLNARSIVAFTGAGLSAESGVATFRDASTNALWKNFDPAQLASPEGFREHPSRVIDWYTWRRRQVAMAVPNAAHRAIASWPGILNVTQNVDDLLERAGCDSDRILRLHGRIDQDRCHGGCGFEESIDLSSPPPLRHCPSCGRHLRPSVVWFGEPLDHECWTRAMEACMNAEILLVVGTSASVYPAAGLIPQTRANGARILVVNPESGTTGDSSDLELIGRAGEIVPRLLLPQHSGG